MSKVKLQPPPAGHDSWVEALRMVEEQGALAAPVETRLQFMHEVPAPFPLSHTVERVDITVGEALQQVYLENSEKWMASGDKLEAAGIGPREISEVMHLLYTGLGKSELYDKFAALLKLVRNDKRY